MQDIWGEKGGRQSEEEMIERKVDMRLREEFRRFGLHQPASGGPVGSEAK